MVFLLLLGLTKCSATNTDYLQRVDALETPCNFVGDNIATLQKLLEEADLCDEDWEKDTQDYIDRLKDQNGLLEDMNSKEYQNIYQAQVTLLSALEDFYETQSKEDLKDLEEATKEYQKLYQENCRGKGV